MHQNGKLQNRLISASIFRNSPSPTFSMQNLSHCAPISKVRNLDIITSRAIKRLFTLEEVTHNPSQYTGRRSLLVIDIRPETVDKLSLVCFPLAFTLFNFVYWWYYLFRTSEHTGGMRDGKTP
uniref:Gamma-aminobutyric acid receptor subunit beta n=1 Tax=Elaeophora elaphi TaxID=1147741 RepID=A0A0R3RHU7_9BILA